MLCSILYAESLASYWLISIYLKFTAFAVNTTCLALKVVRCMPVATEYCLQKVYLYEISIKHLLSNIS